MSIVSLCGSTFWHFLGHFFWVLFGTLFWVLFWDIFSVNSNSPMVRLPSDTGREKEDKWCCQRCACEVSTKKSQQWGKSRGTDLTKLQLGTSEREVKISFWTKLEQTAYVGSLVTMLVVHGLNTVTSWPVKKSSHVWGDSKYRKSKQVETIFLCFQLTENFHL